MLYKTYSSLLVSLILLMARAEAQVGGKIPEVYDQFYNNYYLLNPAATDTSRLLRLQLGNNSQTGLFEGVRRTYFDSDFRITTARRARLHFVGLQLVNNTDGPHFRRNRIYGRYSLVTRVSRGALLAAGVSAGFVNYTFQATQASAGGSDIAIDGNAGIWYLRSRLGVGLSAQQIFRQTLQPINQVFELYPYFNFNTYYTFYLNPFAALTTHMFVRPYRNYPVNIEVAPIFLLQDKVEFGLDYRHKKSLAVIAGIKSVKVGGSIFSFMASYSSGILNYTSTGDHGIEFYLNYSKQ